MFGLRRRLKVLLAIGIGLVASCGGDPEVTSTPDFTSGGAGGSAATGGAGVGGTGTGGTLPVPDGSGGTGGVAGAPDGCAGEECGPAPSCGDGKLNQSSEECDDGNPAPGDGCTECKLDEGWACPVPGQACVPTAECGDGVLSGTEQCDDRNQTGQDGCSADCEVEPGWRCPVPGARCEPARCGDGLRVGREQCDDGDDQPNDGCSATCQLEEGWACDAPNTPCRRTTCGDGTREGTEQCDDGNNDLGDGCTVQCKLEPRCPLGTAQSPGGACSSVCGDGFTLAGDTEECDDGNTVAGDGCSPTCRVEAGYQCERSSVLPNPLVLPIVLRDFRSWNQNANPQNTHPDFENYNAGRVRGLVQDVLDADGKPAFRSRGPSGSISLTSEADFRIWYRDDTATPRRNFTVVDTLTLPRQGATNTYRFQSGAFFPLDGRAFGNQGRSNNFHFTSEVRYWFEYARGQRLDFTGDDDVWVFVNRRLAVDIGGVHGEISDGITLDQSNEASLGLTPGSVYEIVVFQAERHTTRSNYRLTLSNFVSQRWVCTSRCGDGVVTPDEVCDDGVNDGGYGECAPGCVRGPFCGDGTVDAAAGEECDEPPNLTGYGTSGCAPGCKRPGRCGDGRVDSLFGEQCDDGVNAGGYGKCGPDCKLEGGYCGDGIRQPGEECDDGNRRNNDGCSADCRIDGPA